MANVTKVTKRDSKNRSVKSQTKTNMTRRELALEKKKIEAGLDAQTRAQVERTKRVQAISGAASTTANAIAGAATTASTVKSTEKTRQQQMQLLNPVVEKSTVEGSENNVTSEDGGVLYI